MGQTFGTYTGSDAVFSFTLRKADDTELGLNVSHQEHDRVLCIEGVMADGAVDAWNRQCRGSALLEKVVFPGDKIISVNNVAYNADKMLEECKEKRLLRLTVARGEYPLPEVPACTGSVNSNSTNNIGIAINSNINDHSSSSLRATASEFVPMEQAKMEPAAAVAKVNDLDATIKM